MGHADAVRVCGVCAELRAAAVTVQRASRQMAALSDNSSLDQQSVVTLVRLCNRLEHLAGHVEFDGLLARAGGDELLLALAPFVKQNRLICHRVARTAAHLLQRSGASLFF